MIRLYTKNGDNGTTRLADGSQVSKTDIRIEANGCLDELNAILGITKNLLKENGFPDTIENIQHNIMDIMSVVAGYKKDISALEEETNRMEEIMETDNGHFKFVTPGSSMANALLHTARAKSRTCERRLWKINATYPMPSQILVYMNRLSDYLFFLAEKEY